MNTEMSGSIITKIIFYLRGGNKVFHLLRTPAGELKNNNYEYLSKG